MSLVYYRGGELTARVPKMTRLSNFNGTRKIKIVNNYVICKSLFIKIQSNKLYTY